MGGCVVAKGCGNWKNTRDCLDMKIQTIFPVFVTSMMIKISEPIPKKVNVVSKIFVEYRNFADAEEKLHPTSGFEQGTLF